MSISKYEQALSKLHSDILFLLVTATDRESESLLEALKPLDNYNEIEKLFVENETYHIGKLGIYNVVHVQCGSMGTVGRDSSINTVSNAIKHWKPHAIIMVGIAFGMDAKKQQIGDVLVSQAIVNYESARISHDETIYRGNRPESGKILLNRFQNMLNWHFPLDEGHKARKHVGLIVSGEKLVDNDEFKNNLRQNFPNAIGGEMEGFGVYSASANAGINEWIIIKGLCDWADGNKSKNKSEYQQTAAKSVVSLCKAVLSEKAFDDLVKIDNRPNDLNSISLYADLVPKESLYTINVNNTKYSFFGPQQVFNGSSRSKFVKIICDSIQRYRWVNLWGNVWSGKSQLLLLLSKQFPGYYWINLKSKNPDEAFQTLFHLMASSIGYVIVDIDHLITMFLGNFKDNTVFLVDDIPFIPRGHILLDLLIHLCCIAEQKQIRLVTTGNQDLTSIVNNVDVHIAINIPPMDGEEVKEILQEFKAPSRIIRSNVNEMLAVNGRTPAIIMALVKYMADKSWNIDDSVFDAIIKSNAGEVSFELQRLINHTIPNEETRELLYRIAIVGHEISQDYISKIAYTNPSVHHPLERLNELLGLWIISENHGQYSVPKSIRKLAEENVGKELKKQVSLIVAEQIIKKRTLDQFDVTYLIEHFLEAEKYEDAGNVYIRALWEIDNSDYTYDPFMFTAFWGTLPLPDQMSDDLKCRIRLLQIKVFCKLNKDVSFVVNDFIVCSEKQKTLYHYLLIGAATIGFSNADVAMDLFYRALIKDATFDFHDSDLLPMNISSTITFLTAGRIKELSRLKKWFINLKLVKPEEIQEGCKQQEEFYASIFIALERVKFKALAFTCNKELLKETREVFSEMQQYGQKINWAFFYALAAREQLQLINSLENYQEVCMFYNSAMIAVKDDQLSDFLMASMLAMISLDGNNYKDAKALIMHALTVEVHEDYLLLEKINLHLALASLFSEENAENSIEETQKALDLVIPSVEWGLAYKLKIYGEHVINIYLNGFTEQHINLYFEVAKLLLENETFEGREEVIALWCHVLTYIVNDIVYDNKPTKIGEEDYTPPMRKMFINSKNAEWFRENHSEDKFFSALFFISDLLSFYGKANEAKEIIREAVIQKNILPKETNTLSNLGLVALVSSYTWLQTMRLNMIPDAFALLNGAYEHVYGNTTSNNVFKTYFTTHICMITVSFVNRYIEVGRDTQAEIIKSFATEISNFCESYKDIPLVYEYKKMISEFIENHSSSDDLIHVGNTFKVSFPELQVIAYILSTAKLPITQNTLIIQVDTLHYISLRTKPNDALYRIEYLQYLNNTWIDILKGEKRLNFDLEKAKSLMTDAVVAPKLEDIKQVLRLLINGFDIQTHQEVTKWLFE